MKNRLLIILLSVAAYSPFAGAQSFLNCPGGVVQKDKLACQPNAAFKTYNGGLSGFSPTLAAQLNQLPLATAITGSGLVIGSTGIPTAATESLGSILTERGSTLGKPGKFYVSFNYQRFQFSSLGGADLKKFTTVFSNPANGGGTLFVSASSRFDITDEQYTALGVVGVTKWLDLAIIVPFSKVTLKTQTFGPGSDPTKPNSYEYLYTPPNPSLGITGGFSSGPLVPEYLAGSAHGIGDVEFNVKLRLFGGEEGAKNHLAVGAEIRLPTGDEYNLLGTGSTGAKPYIVFSRNSFKGRLVTHVNSGYQFNGRTAINPDPNDPQLKGRKLPESYQYSAGADLALRKEITVVADLIGQMVLKGDVVRPGVQKIGVVGPGGSISTPDAGTPRPDYCDSSWSCQSLITASNQTYTINNLSVGVKWNLWKGWILSGNALIKLDNAGLRSKVVPLIGLAYRF